MYTKEEDNRADSDDRTRRCAGRRGSDPEICCGSKSQTGRNACPDRGAAGFYLCGKPGSRVWNSEQSALVFHHHDSDPDGSHPDPAVPLPSSYHADLPGKRADFGRRAWQYGGPRTAWLCGGLYPCLVFPARVQFCGLRRRYRNGLVCDPCALFRREKTGGRAGSAEKTRRRRASGWTVSLRGGWRI